MLNSVREPKYGSKPKNVAFLLVDVSVYLSDLWIPMQRHSRIGEEWWFAQRQTWGKKWIVVTLSVLKSSYVTCDCDRNLSEALHMMSNSSYYCWWNYSYTIIADYFRFLLPTGIQYTLNIMPGGKSRPESHRIDNIHDLFPNIAYEQLTSWEGHGFISLIFFSHNVHNKTTFYEVKPFAGYLVYNLGKAFQKIKCNIWFKERLVVNVCV